MSMESLFLNMDNHRPPKPRFKKWFRLVYHSFPPQEALDFFGISLKSRENMEKHSGSKTPPTNPDFVWHCLSLNEKLVIQDLWKYDLWKYKS